MGLKNMISEMQMGMPAQAPSAKQPMPKPAIAAMAKAPGDPSTHLKAAHAAHKKGDHAEAKRHAFKAIQAMPSMAGPAGPTGTMAPQ